jgi:TPR repeat protein
MRLPNGWGFLSGMRALTAPAAARSVIVTAAVLCLVAPLIGCDDGGYWFRHRIAEGACPRPQSTFGDQPQFGAQQLEIRFLRERGFRDDFFSELELARRYEGARAADKNLEDPVESAVWYALALVNESGYSPIASHGQDHWNGPLAVVAHFDDCRAFERADAYHKLDYLLSRMDSDERDKVRDRVTYILTTRGADGFRTLARLHDGAFGPFGEPLDNEQGRWARGGVSGQIGAPNALGLFTRSDVDTYLYDYLAAQTGDVGAYVLLRDFQNAHGGGAFTNAVEAKADRWVPPYEFYPPEAPESGVPHSDESKPVSDAEDAALARIGELPFTHVADALTFLRVTAHPVPHESDLPPSSIKAFQAMLGRPQTGFLTPLERVRAIQYAATNGSAHAQLVLAVMYSEGVGVPCDYARAYHWYEQADKQGSGEAKFAMSQYFSLGVQGVADQDKAKAVILQLDAALSGFHPSEDKLQAILNRVYRAPHARFERYQPW